MDRSTCLCVVILTFAMVMPNITMVYLAALNSNYGIVTDRLTFLDERVDATCYASDRGDVNTI